MPRRSRKQMVFRRGWPRSFHRNRLFVFGPLLAFLPCRNPFGVLLGVADLTACACAAAAPQSLTIPPRFVRGLLCFFGPTSKLQPPGINLSVLFNPAFDDVFFGVVAFHVLSAVCFAVDYKCAAALLCKFYGVWRVRSDDFCFVYFVIRD